MSEINVTNSSLPQLAEFMPYLADIWASKQLTNNGKYCQLFEEKLCEYLNVPYVSVITNGTIALMIALKAMDVKGEVLTSPFTFQATKTAIEWAGCIPVYCDIEETGFNIDYNKIKGGPRAIMPIHCYGFPSIPYDDFKYEKIIFDACHAFGVKYHGNSLLMHGDLSVVSFHATKVFNTFEGGMIVSHNRNTKDHIDELRNFGFKDNHIFCSGINGKMDELRAAIGLCNLKKVDRDIEKRHEIFRRYNRLLSDFERPFIERELEYNYSYYPMLFDNRDKIFEALRTNGINARKYFQLVCNPDDVYKFPNAKRAADRILCLPIYPDLELKTVDKICEIICRTL